MRRTRLVTLVVVPCLVVLTACGVSAESTPREINAAVDDGSSDDETTPEIGTDQIFLVQADVSGSPLRLVPAARDLDTDPAAVFDVLMAGATEAEQADKTTTVLPSRLELRSARVGSGVVTLDVGAAFTELSGRNLVFALAQLVYTFDGLPDVDGVRITIDGTATPWPDVNGQLQSDELTVFDYPGLLRTTQPAFPAVPSA